MPTLPTFEETITQAKTLPQSGQSRLSSFAGVLNEATNLARSKRMKFEQELLGKEGFVPGQVEPGTFASILKASEKKSSGFQEPLKTGTSLTKEQFGTVTPEQVETIGELLNSGYPLSSILDKFDNDRQLEIASALNLEGHEIGLLPEERKRIEASGLLNAPRDEQLLFLLGEEKPKEERTVADLIKDVKEIILNVRVTGGDREAAAKKLEQHGFSPVSFKKELDLEYGKEDAFDFDSL